MPQMLPADFVENVRELIALAKECPENLQEKCLQMLLEDFLKRSGGDVKKTRNPRPRPTHEPPLQRSKNNHQKLPARTRNPRPDNATY